MLRKLTLLAGAGLAVLITVVAVAEAQPGEGRGRQGGGRRGQMRRPAGPEGFFKRHDANQDGKVTLEEITAKASELITKADTDGDGAVTMEELKAAKPEGRPGSAGGPGGEGKRERPSPEDVFARIDADGSGQISLEEFKAAHERKGGRRGPPGDDK